MSQRDKARLDHLTRHRRSLRYVQPLSSFEDDSWWEVVQWKSGSRWGLSVACGSTPRKAIDEDMRRE